VAKQIVNLATRDARNIIVTINPLTFITYPIKEFCVGTYFKLFSRPTDVTQVVPFPETLAADATTSSRTR